MFIVLLKYTKPLEEIDRLMGAHVRFLQRYYKEGKFVVAGRRIPREGGVILARVDSVEELAEILVQDPFYQEQAAEFEAVQFRTSTYAPDFKVFADPGT